MTQKNSECYNSNFIYNSINSITNLAHEFISPEKTKQKTDESTLSTVQQQKCYFCGSPCHSCSICPAKNAMFKSCGKKGMY